MGLLSKDQQTLIRNHLASILHKYSDADSSILSDYIVALLAKDGTQTQIRKDCNAELSAFMMDKTEQFVVELFNFIDNNLLNTNAVTPDRPRPRTKHHRKVEVQSKSSNGNIVITRNSKDINNGSTEQQIGSVAIDSNDGRQHDFVVSSTPTPPNSSYNNKNHQSPKAASPKPPNHHKYGKNNSYRRQHRKQHHHHQQQHPSTSPSNSNNLQALTQLLGLVQQNIQQAQAQQAQQAQQYQTRRSMQNVANFVPPYVARPIIQQTPTPNIIQTQSAQNGANHTNHNILDRRLDEIRLPPNNDPFYQDDRFNAINKKNNQIDTKRIPSPRGKYVGKKRNFSKMNDTHNH